MTTKFIGVACLAAGAALAGIAGVVDAKLTSPAAPVAAVSFEDVVSGDWDGFISNEQMPEDIAVLINLALEGEDVTGGFTVQEETADFSGEFDAENNTISGVLSDPESGQDLDVEMSIDGDELTGTITVVAGEMTIILEINATRVEE